MKRSRINAPADVLFRWHAEPGAFERLSPPWEPVEFIVRAPGIQNGDRGALAVRLGPFRVRWEFEHRGYVEGRQFQDVQTRGPFRRWEHTHRFTPDGDAACWLEDRVEYELPFGFLGRWFGATMVRKRLERLFAWRHTFTAGAMSELRSRRSTI